MNNQNILEEATHNEKFLRMLHGQGQFFQKAPLAAGGKKKPSWLKRRSRRLSGS